MEETLEEAKAKFKIAYESGSGTRRRPVQT